MPVKEMNPSMVRDVDAEVTALVNSSRYTKSSPPENGAAGANETAQPGAPISEVTRGSR